MRDKFISKLTELAYLDADIFLIVGDLGFGVVEDFAKKFPNRFLNVGISEQNMIGVAGGLANSGYKVFIYSIANFPTMRCFEQIRNDLAYHNLDVTIVSIGAGFGYGTLGYSHFAIEDLSVMRSLPNLEIYSPGDPYELEVTVENILERKGAKYLRIGKNGESQLDGQVLNSPLFARTLRNGFEIAVLSTGNIGIEVEKAINAFHPDLQNNFAHFSIPSLSTSAMESVGFEKYNKIITIEEHVLDGGFGSFVLEYLEHRQFSKKIKRLGIKRNFEYVVGDQAFLRKLAGIDSQSIHSELERLLQV